MRVEDQRSAPPGLALERLVFFSDAVIAIAITLLAIDLRLPDTHIASDRDFLRLLTAVAPHYLAFAISFAVIGLYWIAHHRMFRYLARFDGRVVFLNLLFLFFVAQLPFLTATLGAHGNLSSATAIYALGLAAIGFSSSGLWLYALRRELTIESLSPETARYIALRAATVPIVFLASLPLAFISPFLGQLSWIAIFPVQRALARRLQSESGGRAVASDADDLSLTTRMYQMPHSASARSTASAQRRPARAVDSPGVRFPPPLIFAGAVVLGLLFKARWPLPIGGGALRVVPGWLLVAAWLVLMVSGFQSFWRKRTTLIPNRPAAALVTSGPYRFTRNPMYVSLTLLTIALALLIDTWWLIVFLPAALLVLQVYVIAPEERYLRRRFGPEYDAYTRRVRRWL